MIFFFFFNMKIIDFLFLNKQDLFSEYGPLTKCKIDYDDLGRSRVFYFFILKIINI